VDGVLHDDAFAGGKIYDRLLAVRNPFMKTKIFRDNVLKLCSLWKKAKRVDLLFGEALVARYIRRIHGGYPPHWFYTWQTFSTPKRFAWLLYFKVKVIRAETRVKITAKLLKIPVLYCVLPRCSSWRFYGRKGYPFEGPTKTPTHEV